MLIYVLTIDWKLIRLSGSGAVSQASSSYLAHTNEYLDRFAQISTSNCILQILNNSLRPRIRCEENIRTENSDVSF
jgi:hypothetical protein